MLIAGSNRDILKSFALEIGKHLNVTFGDGSSSHYTATFKQIYYLESSSNKIKVASHVRFDEGYNDLSVDALPPYARHLRRALGHALEKDDSEIGVPADLDIFGSEALFPVTFSYLFRVLPSDITNEYDTLGFLVKP
jgi:hypothetical protein